MAKEIGNSPPRACSENGCDRKVHARGLCKFHHKRALSKGLMSRKIKSVDNIDNNISHCPTTGCWLWTGPCDRNGYGYICIGSKKIMVHRYLAGVSDSSICVCHKCDTPACVNPDHMFFGSQVDNMRDMNAKGRHFRPRGEIHPKSKISNSLAAKAREMFSSGFTRKQISDHIHLGYRSTCLLLQGKTWEGIE